MLSNKLLKERCFTKQYQYFLFKFDIENRFKNTSSCGIETSRPNERKFKYKKCLHS